MAKKEQFDAMGQPIGTEQGDPDPAAAKAIETAQEQSSLKPLVEPPPSRKKAAKSSKKPMAEEAREALVEALKDPDILREVVTPDFVQQVVNTASQDAGLRKVLDLPTGAVPPSGEHQRNYQAEPALRVYGGVEVEHGPDFVRLPPSYITKFMAEDPEVGKTDLEHLAAKEANGKPVKTQEYKHFLDVRARGERLDGKVQFDIVTDQFTPGDIGIAL